MTFQFFSRLAAKACQQEVQVTEQDVQVKVEEQVNFSTARHLPSYRPPYCCRSVRSVCLS